MHSSDKFHNRLPSFASMLDNRPFITNKSQGRGRHGGHHLYELLQNVCFCSPFHRFFLTTVKRMLSEYFKACVLIYKYSLS